MTSMQQLYLLVPLAPLAGALIAGLAGRAIGRAGAQWVTILGVTVSFFASVAIFFDVLNGNVFNGSVYTWLTSGETRFEIGFLIDRLTVLMMVVVTFVSLMVPSTPSATWRTIRATSASSPIFRCSPSPC